MKYYYSDQSKAPVGKPIWGLAYDINDDTERHDLKCEPVLGEIVNNGLRYNSLRFVPYKKGTKVKRGSGSVRRDSRMYADTYEEAVEMYNDLVQRRIDNLQRMIESAKSDMIGKEVQDAATD